MPNLPISLKNTRQLSHILALVIVVLFLISGIITLPFYGVTWDESLGNFFFGERYLRYMTSFDQRYLDFDSELVMHTEHPLNLYLSPFRDRPEEFPALLDVASAASMYLFSYGLGWLDPVEAFHLFTILLVSLFLYLFYLFFVDRIGTLATLFALIFLASFPRLWGDMHFNVKDVPEMALIGLSLMAYWRWFEKPSLKWAALVGIAGGAALGVKANALFLPVIIVLGVWSASWRELWRHITSCVRHYYVMVICAIGVYFLSWPYLYKNPLNALKYFAYISSQGGRIGSTRWNWQPLEITIASMPEMMLICLLVGIALAVFWTIRRYDRLMLFVLAWCSIPILRISFPPSVNFDGIRHFLEFLPAAAVLAGVGASGVIHGIARRAQNLKTPAGIALALIISANIGLFWNNFGPYQHIFFNSFIGGLPGAVNYFGSNEATDYWGSSYRQGIQWLNVNAPIDSAVYVPVAGHIVDVSAPIWLRPDIKVISEAQLSNQPQGREVFVMFITRPIDNKVMRQCQTNGKAIHEILIQGVPILQIYKW